MRLSQVRRMSKYAELSKDELVRRLEAFEAGETTGSLVNGNLNSAGGSSLGQEPQTSASPTANLNGIASKAVKACKARKPVKPFDFPSHPTRHIALLIGYHGWHYSGLAIQLDVNSPGPIRTVEGELLMALEKARLIEEGKGLEGAGYSRCGRTDRGVSGTGQVVDLWVRSARRADDGGGERTGWREALKSVTKQEVPLDDAEPGDGSEAGPSKPRSAKARPPPPPPAEFPYPRLLNGILPPSIRVLAWAPLGNAPDPSIEGAPASAFNSRFSCAFRHYKYAFHPTPTPQSPPLDVEVMGDAAQLLLGEHDFRNFCKLDGSKQIENHSRRVVKAYFEREGDLWVFNLIGSAFLWHQVRHIISVLFLIGSKLEDKSIVTELLDVERYPGKPAYQMGDPIPLTLWKCGYTEELEWRYSGYDGSLSADQGTQKGAEGIASLERQLEQQRQEADLKAWQIGNLLKALHRTIPDRDQEEDVKEDKGTTMYPVGGGDVVITTKYKAVLERPMGETPDEVNRKWREKGKRRPKGDIAP